MNLKIAGLSPRFDGGKYLSKLFGESNASVAIGVNGSPGFGGRYLSIGDGGVMGGGPKGLTGSNEGDLGSNDGDLGSNDGDLGCARPHGGVREDTM